MGFFGNSRSSFYFTLLHSRACFFGIFYRLIIEIVLPIIFEIPLSFLAALCRLSDRRISPSNGRPHKNIAANDSRRCSLRVVSNHLTRSVQYFLYNQLPLALETFCRATIAYDGNAFHMHSYSCSVAIPLEKPWAELNLILCVHYTTTVHLTWESWKVSIMNFHYCGCFG